MPSFSLRATHLCLWSYFFILCTAASLYAADGGEAFTSAEKAGPDFAIQGEYSGSVNTPDGTVVYGTQIVALGDGRFDLIGYRGGLPGDGWLPGKETRTAKGEMSGGMAVFQAQDFTAEVKEDVLTVKSNGQVIGTLKKMHRESPTLGAKPPEGALVLLDGTSADAFEGGKLDDDKFLMPGTVSKEKFGDHSAHIEFRTPFMPKSRGQGRGNSGVYVHHRYECQVLDSFGLEGLDNECGGFYQQAKPLVNMCFPPLSWQTYDYDFTAAKYDNAGKKTANARITLKHNGVVVHKDLEFKKETPGGIDEGPEPGALFLQDHGNPVAFRNIWIVKK